MDDELYREKVAKISFRTALDIVCDLAESSVSGVYFSYRDVRQLENAARNIRLKLEAGQIYDENTQAVIAAMPKQTIASNETWAEIYDRLDRSPAPPRKKVQRDE